MIRNCLTIAFRILLRNRAYSLINIIGLAIGMACSLLVLLYVQLEVRFGGIHENGHRVYRVLRETRMSGSASRFSSGTSAPVSRALLEDFPEVEASARILNWSHWVRIGDRRIRQRQGNKWRRGRQVSRRQSCSV